jgi:hypothetical protein
VWEESSGQSAPSRNGALSAASRFSNSSEAVVRTNQRTLSWAGL